MLWIAASLFFLWCAFRELRASFVAPSGYDLPRPVYKPYLVVVLFLAAIFAYVPVHRWHFEHFLSAKATELADNHRAKVHCNTVFDTMLDPEMLAAGHANKEIAARLSLSEDTVKGQVSKILAKLGASDRTHAVVIGLKRGIIAL